MRVLVVKVMKEAASRAGKQRALLNQIEGLTGRSFKENSVSAWTLGRNTPNADVFLAAVKANAISLDELLYGESLLSRQDRLEEKLDRLSKLVETRPLLAGNLPEPVQG